MKLKILLTCAKSAEAMRLRKALQESGYDVLLADYGDVPGFSGIFSLGEENKNAYAHQLLKFCLDKDIDLIFPLKEAEINALTAAAVLLEEFNIRVAVTSTQQLQQVLANPAIIGMALDTSNENNTK